jgi:hypothetical protein
MTVLLTLVALFYAAVFFVMWAMCKAAGMSDDLSDRLFRKHMNGQERK